MAFTVRSITTDEIDDWSNTVGIGFQHPAEESDREARRKHLLVERAWAAFDGDQMVGTACSFPTPLTVPGGATVPAAAVTGVAVIPTHLRRGAMTAMMRAQLDEVATRGEPAAVLIAAEAPIYGRFGYGSATRHTTVELDTAHIRFATPPAQHRVRFVERDELRTVAPVVFDRARAGQPGEIGRNDYWWDMHFGIIERSFTGDLKKRIHVVAEGDDGPDGYLLYRVNDEWAGRLPDHTATVDALVASSLDAYTALWNHLLRIDWVTKIEAADRPVDEPLRLLVTDTRRVKVTLVSDFLWCRLIDVPTCLAARTYSVADRLVLEVTDRFRPQSGGRFVLDGGPDGAISQATASDPDLVLDTADLAAAWLGGESLWFPASVGRVGERTPGAVRRFDAMFLSQPPPFCATWF